MMRLIISRLSTPDKHGFPDVITSPEHLVAFPCGSNPNPFRPSNKEPWYKCYGQAAEGTYIGKVIQHEKFGKCVYIDGRVPSKNPNPNQNGKYYLTEMFIHEANLGGVSESWRGSAGCFTLPRSCFTDFIELFPENEKLEIILMER